MDAVSFDDLAAVAAVAFLAPLLLGLVPALRVPSVLLEIGAGVVLGPSVLGWVQADAAVDVLALIGVGLLLLLAGLEIGSTGCAGPCCGSRSPGLRSPSRSPSWSATVSTLRGSWAHRSWSP